MDGVWVYGYAAVWGDRTRGRYRSRMAGRREVESHEVVGRDCFTPALTRLRRSSVNVVLDHSERRAFGASTGNGRLRLEQDERGLFFAACLPYNNSRTSEFHSGWRQGRWRHVSLCFGPQRYGKTSAGGADSRFERELVSVATISHIGLVTEPAYPRTWVHVADTADALRLERGQRPSFLPGREAFAGDLR